MTTIHVRRTPVEFRTCPRCGDRVSIRTRVETGRPVTLESGAAWSICEGLDGRPVLAIDSRDVHVCGGPHEC